MKIHYLQHVPFEGPANIEPWVNSRGHGLSATKLFAGEKPGPHMDFDLLLIMGGPMNIYEEGKYPWLIDEKKFIEKTIAAGKGVLGICLGAQLIAGVLGGRVYKNRHREIGWHPVGLTPEAKDTFVFHKLPQHFTAFHWHGDTFDIPPGAVHTAKSEACLNQSFSYREKVVGLQFHLESSGESIEKLIENCGEEITGGKYIQSPERMRRGFHCLKPLNLLMCALLDQLESICAISE